jgi:hypothetical protein
MTNRERFEQWLHSEYESCGTSLGGDFRRDDAGDYILSEIQVRWDVWQAAMANDQRRSVQDMEDAITAGVQMYKDFRCERAVDDALIQAAIVGTLRWATGVEPTEKHFNATAMMNAAVDAGRELRESQPAT